MKTADGLEELLAYDEDDGDLSDVLRRQRRRARRRTSVRTVRA